MLNDIGKTELAKFRDMFIDHAKDQRDRTALLERIDAKTAQADDRKGKIDFADFLKFLLLLCLRRLTQQRIRIRRLQHRPLFNRLKTPVDPEHRRTPDRDVQVGSLPLDSEAQQIF